MARARGALYGLAIGDALGMPTQLLSRAQIRDRWGDQLTGFEPASPDHPIAAGMPAGSVTDDTEQAILLGRLLVSGHGTIEPNEFASALVHWEHDMAEAARRLVRRSDRADIIVRSGPDGCVLAVRMPGSGSGHSLSLSHVAAPAVTAVDTTGAGDAHSGVFLAALAAGLTTGEAARRANVAAALAVTRAGAATSPTRAELDRFLAF